MKRIRTLLADDQPMILEGVRTLLDAQADIEVVGEARNGLDALALVRKQKPDVVLLDINMPHMSGVEALPLLKDASPDTAIVVLSMHSLEVYVLEALHAGAIGYISKTTPASHLLQALRSAASGKYYLYPESRSVAVDSFLRSVGVEGLEAVVGQELFGGAANLKKRENPTPE